MNRIMAALGLAMLLAGTPMVSQAQTQTQTPATSPAAKPVVPPRPAAAPAAALAIAASAMAGKRIDLNGATEAQLDTLPGVGPVRAKALVANRPYDTIESVTAKKALPPNVLAGIRDRVALADINTSSARDLQRTLPGIGDTRAAQIVAGRPYAAPADLVTKGILTQAVFDKVKDLVAY